MTPLQYQKQLRLLEARRSWFPMPPLSKRPPSKLGMKAHPNSAVNMPESSGFLRDAIYRHSDALLPDIASG